MSDRVEEQRHALQAAPVLVPLALGRGLQSLLAKKQDMFDFQPARFPCDPVALL